MKSRLAFMAIGLVCAAAFAQTPGEQGEQGEPSSPFDMLDADSSGGIDETEAQAHPLVSENFAVVDVNTDGIITREEFSAAFTSKQPGTTPEEAETSPPAEPPT